MSKTHRGRKRDRGRLVVHIEDPQNLGWCLCGVAGLYETPNEWVCYRTAAPVGYRIGQDPKGPPPQPIGLTRGGISHGR